MSEAEQKPVEQQPAAQPSAAPAEVPAAPAALDAFLDQSRQRPLEWLALQMIEMDFRHGLPLNPRGGYLSNDSKALRPSPRPSRC